MQSYAYDVPTLKLRIKNILFCLKRKLHIFYLDGFLHHKCKKETLNILKKSCVANFFVSRHLIYTYSSWEIKILFVILSFARTGKDPLCHA